VNFSNLNSPSIAASDAALKFKVEFLINSDSKEWNSKFYLCSRYTAYVVSYYAYQWGYYSVPEPESTWRHSRPDHIRGVPLTGQQWRFANAYQMQLGIDVHSVESISWNTV